MMMKLLLLLLWGGMFFVNGFTQAYANSLQSRQIGWFVQKNPENLTKLLLLDFNSPILLHSHTRYLSYDIPKSSKPLSYPFFLL